ncbi:MAG: sigma-70 family RNA polymerase sigma factor [Anaerolineae bacterium]|nr:sigma-70 family RNA polymerase sigma factor [Anaerolineae bacterium]
MNDMPLQKDEQYWVKQARQGDPKALESLYNRYVDEVFRYMLYHTGDSAVAEDLTAEVFAGMLTSIQRYKERGRPFAAWLFSIARARRADYWRRVHRQAEHEIVLSEDFEIMLPGATPEDRFAYEGLVQALEYLTASEREVIILRFAGGLNNGEIAQVVHSNANAVKSKMRRALMKLRGVLKAKAAFSVDGGMEDESN